jgi:hypothetical protein
MANSTAMNFLTRHQIASNKKLAIRIADVLRGASICSAPPAPSTPVRNQGWWNACTYTPRFRAEPDDGVLALIVRA